MSAAPGSIPSGGGCTVAGATRADGSWTQTLGQVTASCSQQPVLERRSRLACACASCTRWTPAWSAASRPSTSTSSACAMRGPRAAAPGDLRAGEREPGVQLRLPRPRGRRAAPGGHATTTATASTAASNEAARSPSPAAGRRCQPFAQAAPKVDLARLDYGLAARALAPGVWVVEGANADFSPANGCNIINTGFIATGAGVVVINTGPSRRYGEQLRALIARTTREPVRAGDPPEPAPRLLPRQPGLRRRAARWPPTPRAPAWQREAKAYEDNLYRLCGDWMKGTEAAAAHADRRARAAAHRRARDGAARVPRPHRQRPGAGRQGQRRGVRRRPGVRQRMPTTPHADPPPGCASLDALARRCR